MEINIRSIVLFFSIFTTALSAGFFYSWMVSVIPGTRKIPDQAYVETMQSINREILNPGFFAIFFGALILLFLSTFLQYKVKVDSTFYFILSATLIYTIGTIGVTIFGNVPLNDYLEALDLSTLSAEDFREAREIYEAKWNQLHLIRTIATLMAFGLLLYPVLRSN